MVAWENLFYRPVQTAASPYVQNLFGGEAWLFWSLILGITVTVTYVKSESPIVPVAVLIVMGPLLGALVGAASTYIFGTAAAGGVGLILYMLYQGSG